MRLACLLALLLAPRAWAQGGPDREYRIKAVFLYHFTQFVEWPDSALGPKDKPVVVGVLGNDPFGHYLEEVVAGERVKDRPLVVKRFSRAEDAREAHILFISPSETPRRLEILAALGGGHTLTVGEGEGFCRQGGMVCFLNRKGKVRLEINLEAAKAAHLSLSSKLLRLAETVTPAGAR